MIVVSQQALVVERPVTGHWQWEQDVRQLAESKLLTVYLLIGRELIAALSAESAGRKLYRQLQGDPLRECLR